MKHKKTLISAMVASVMLVGCGDDANSEGGNPPSSSTYTLYVTVVDEVNNNKVEGADVIIDGKTVTTDTDGLAEFELASGTYSVEVDEAVGYFNEYASVTINGDKSVTYELEEYDESKADGATAAIAASSVGNDASFAYQWETWDSGTVIGSSSDSYYSDIVTLASGTGWGTDNAVLAFGNDPIAAINIEQYSHLALKVDPSSFNGTALAQAISATGYVEVEIQTSSTDPQIITAELNTGSQLEGDWIQLLVPLPDVQDMTWVAMKFAGQGTMNVTDIYFSELREGTPAEDDGSNPDPDPEPDPTEPTTSLYSATTGSAEGITFAEPDWGSGSSLVALDKTDEGNYDHVMEWAMGGGWGGEGVENGFAVAAAIDGLSGIADSGYFNVKFKYTDTNSATAGALEIQMPDYTTQTVYDTDTQWMTLENGWVQVTVPVSGFAIPEGDDPDRIVLILKDDAANPVYFTDINFTDTDDSGSDGDGNGDGSGDGDGNGDNNGGDNGGNEGDGDGNGSGEATATIYSSANGSTGSVTFAEPGWGSGSSLTTLDKTDEGNYDHVMEWAMGGGWGGEGVPAGFAVAVSIDGLSGIADTTTFNVKFKYTDTNPDIAGTLEIQMPGGYTTQTIYDTSPEWTVLSNGWVQVSAPVSGFEIPEGDNPTQMVLIIKDDNPNPVYFTDITFD